MNIGNWHFLSESSGPRRALKLLRFLAWFAAACTGVLQIWAFRFWLSPDGNTYLDIASNYLRGDWKNVVNAYWSPLFSWLLACCLAIFHPGPYLESTLLHLLNFVAFLLSLLTFEFFFRAFLSARTQLGWATLENEVLSEAVWWALGYGLFFSTSLFVLSLNITTPDIWVAVWTFLVAGLILRIRTAGGGLTLFAALGLTLACAYLTKSFYFPMSLVFLLTAWLASGAPRKALKDVALGLAIFILFAGPWVFLLSRAKHRLTFGDVGKLAYAISIDDIAQSFYWQGENATGIPKHPVRQLLTKPRLFEFGTPVGGSYPPTYDESYWMEGASPHFNLKGQLRVLRQSFGTMFLFFTDQAEYAVGLLVFFFFIKDKFIYAAALRKQWFLWAPPLAACLSYSLVLTEGRYVAPFLLLLWVAAFSCLLGKPSSGASCAAHAVVFAMLSVTGLRIAKSATSDVLAILGHPENTNFKVAQALYSLGIRPGDKVAGLSHMAQAHWARLAGVKIVSQIPPTDAYIFWAADAETKLKVFQVFASTGAKVVITKDPPPFALDKNWIALGNTGFFAHRLPDQVRGDARAESTASDQISPPGSQTPQ